MRRLWRELALFGLAGVAGFVVDAAVLYALRGWLGTLWARAPSFVAAVFTTWWLNRRFTFSMRPSGLPPGQEFRRYLGLMLLGGVVNNAVFAALVLASDAVRAQPVVAVAAGSLAGMGANLLASRMLLFR